MASPQPQQVQQFGKYTLVERIAVGGMAEIYRAKTFGAAGFEKDLVIKRILPQFSADDDFVRMFIDEARIASRLQHANIVGIFDFDCAPLPDGDSYYIAMELIEGKDLRHLLKEGVRKNLPMSGPMCLHIAIEALKGLHYAHTKQDQGKALNIVHRDVSPHNVLVSYSGDVKISDFGIAKAAARASVTSNGMVKGKLAYMSPEQVTGQPLDGRTDMFSMGICLYEMMTRTRLFVGETEAETIAKVRDAVVPPPRTRNPQIPADVEAAVMQILSHSREGRPINAAEGARLLSQTSWYSANEAIGLGEYVQKLFPPQPRLAVSAPASPPAAVRPKTPAPVAQRPAEDGGLFGGAPPLASSSGVLPPPSASSSGVLPPASAPMAPAAKPIADMSTAILDANNPEAQKVAAAIAAAAAAKSAPAPAKPMADMATAILDANNPEAQKVAAAIAAAQASKSNSSPSVQVSQPHGGAGPLMDQSTAILDANSPQMAQVQAQIAAARNAPPPVSAPPSAMMSGAGPPPGAPRGGQSTVMLDAPNVPPPGGKLPSTGSRAPLAPLEQPKSPSTAMRWVIGPGIMAVTAVVTILLSGLLLPAKAVKDLTGNKPVVAGPKGKINLRTNPSRASVTIDGKSWPKFTPTDVEGEIGKTAHIVCSLDGYAPASADVVFNEEPRPLTLTLDREDPDKVVHVASDSGDPPVDSPAWKKKFGKGDAIVSFFVTGAPATVFVDGQRVRQTPIANFKVKPGKHQIELVNDGKGKHEKFDAILKGGDNPDIRRDWTN